MEPSAPKTVLIRSAGEIASAIAWLLAEAGHRPALVVARPPIAIRRRMAFSDAWFDGRASLLGRAACRLAGPDDLNTVWEGGGIPLIAAECTVALGWHDWSVLVDARMNKQAVPEPQRGLAPLVIGLGPGFCAGGNVDVAVETSWEQLGRVITDGPTLTLSGEPRAVLGHARDRFRYAPCAGVVRGACVIGDRVEPGQIIAHVGAMAVSAVFRGMVRGLTRDGVPVEAGNKIAEIDPRSDPTRLGGIDERPRRIAEAVRAIVAATFP